MIPIAKPIIGEEEKQAVIAVLESGYLAQGRLVQQFEESFATWNGVKHAIATSNGTTALHVALLANGIGVGDEVITTPFTFVATANSILHAGARPVFVDIEPDTFNISPAAIQAALTPKTKAILPVHLYGNPADMRAITDIANRYGLALIEDAAQSHGAKVDGRPVGSFGTGCFSFYPTKNMTSGEGGMVTTNDDAIADRARLLRAHGTRELYKHEMLAFNFRMTDIHAAIGAAQLRKIDHWIRLRQQNASRLSELLGDVVITPSRHHGSEHVYHQYTIRIPGGRGDMPDRLAMRGIGTGVYYPIPLHQQPIYRELGYESSLPHAEQSAQEVLSLPVHPSLTDLELTAIASAVQNEIKLGNF